ncbi:MAG: hypothetical protein O2923_04825 [Verrucomicrobia bacterium]|nr:hypothetical protein [Verrucomicrobiota bacterium]MDA1086759.1 hypothetical protein [Verrucomicrobiota bacterium]
MKYAIALLCAAYMMTASAAFAAEGTDEAPEAPAADETKAQTFKGDAGCAHCTFSEQTKAKACAVALRDGENVYYIKGAEGLDEKMAAQLVKKAFTGKVSVDGTVETDDAGTQWLLVSKVNSITAAKAEGSHKEGSGKQQ